MSVVFTPEVTTITRFTPIKVSHAATQEVALVLGGEQFKYTEPPYDVVPTTTTTTYRAEAAPFWNPTDEITVQVKEKGTGTIQDSKVYSIKHSPSYNMYYPDDRIRTYIAANAGTTIPEAAEQTYLAEKAEALFCAQDLSPMNAIWSAMASDLVSPATTNNGGAAGAYPRAIRRLLQLLEFNGLRTIYANFMAEGHPTPEGFYTTNVYGVMPVKGLAEVSGGYNRKYSEQLSYLRKEGVFLSILEAAEQALLPDNPLRDLLLVGCALLVQGYRLRNDG